MTNASMINGKAYEYACVLALKEAVSGLREIVVLDNSSLGVAERCWNTFDESGKDDLLLSARAGIKSLLKVEPRIVEDGNDSLEISLQADDRGIEGDVRDVLIIRKSIDWEIGISVKHNHNAVKHSRLSKRLDFGEKWLGVPCSKDYFAEITPLFDELARMKREGRLWRGIPDKAEKYYAPLLNAFMKELNEKYDLHGESVPKSLTEYLLGREDYYKLISKKSSRTTRLISFNLNGKLNASANDAEPEIEIPIVELPSRIINLAMKPGSNNTVELHMDNGWEMSFRIHSASSKVEPSLKFDVQFVGMPTSLYIIDESW